MHPDDRASVDERNRTCFATHEPFEDVKRIVRPDGVEFLMRTRGEMVMAGDGTPIRMIGVCEDVSDELHAREADDRLISLVEHSHDAILTCTLEGVITTANPAAAALYGVPAGELAGRSVGRLLPETARESWMAHLRDVGRSGASLHEETLRCTADGAEVEVSVSLSPVRDHAGAVVAVADSARDISDRRKVIVSEQRRRRAMDLNDTVIQSLVLARYRLATEPDDARRSLGQAIAQCQRIVDELLGHRRPGRARLAAPRGSRRRLGRSRGEPLDDPRLARAPEAQPVVQPVGPALPELDGLGDQPQAAPVRGPRDRARPRGRPRTPLRPPRRRRAAPRRPTASLAAAPICEPRGRLAQ